MGQRGKEFSYITVGDWERGGKSRKEGRKYTGRDQGRKDRYRKRKEAYNEGIQVYRKEEVKSGGVQEGTKERTIYRKETYRNHAKKNYRLIKGFMHPAKK